MVKSKVIYICQECGANYNGWAGRCSVCGAWNSLEEQIDLRSSSSSKAVVSSGRLLTPSQLSTETRRQAKRITIGIADVDEVLGGGIVAGSVVLLAGQPGIGKSTLLLQLAHSIAKKSRILYVSAEESFDQVSLRGSRLQAKGEKLHLATSTSANDIAATIASAEYAVVIVDSIQTIAAQEISGVPGSISQVTNCAQLLTAAAKQSNVALLLVGHVTKEGGIAGPKVLEHAVDVVLQLEGDRYGGFRILRSIKNRYGSTNETAIFEMADNGLRIADNPSAALLAERQVSDGSVVLATVEGSRPLLVEVQALVITTSYGYPKRAASGYDLNRLNLLVAMLERRTKLKLTDKDIYINIVGGMKIIEPAADLAVVMAIASAAKGMKLKIDAVVFGELGLSGEVRHVPWIDKRVAEAAKLGFETCIGPKPSGSAKQPRALQAVRDIRSALNTYLTTKE